MTDGLNKPAVPSTPDLARGLIVQAPVRKLDQLIRFDWRASLEGLVKLVQGAVTLDLFAGLEGGAKLLGALQPDDPPEARAWHLIRRSLGRAMAELTVEAVRIRGMVEAEPKDLIEALDRSLDGVVVELDGSFFSRPKDLPFLAVIQPAFGGLGADRRRGPGARIAAGAARPHLRHARAGARHLAPVPQGRATLTRPRPPFGFGPEAAPESG